MATTEAMVTPDGGRTADELFRIEQRGIEYVPESERWSKPRNLFGMWAGALTNFEIFVYGAVLMAFFGVSFAQAVVIIVVGNLSYLLVGAHLAPGPRRRHHDLHHQPGPVRPDRQPAHRPVQLAHPGGVRGRGHRPGGAGRHRPHRQGRASRPGTAWKIVLILVAAGIQLVLPLFGHGTILRTLRWLAVPFALLFVVLACLTLGKVDVHSVHHGAGWASWMAGLAFIIVTSGLGWTENGNDYSRYIPRQADRRAIVGWVFAGTFIPSVLIMILGAAVGTYVPSEGGNPITTLPHVFSGWFLVPFLLVAIVQLFAINSLDLYSSGVTLQAIGLRLRRWQAVLVDTAVAGGLTAYAIFSSSFNTLLTDFVDCVIVLDRPVDGHLPGRLGAAALPVCAGRAAAPSVAASTGATAGCTGRPSSPRRWGCSPH